MLAPARAATLGYKDFSVGARIFTGDPGYTWEEREAGINYAESPSFHGDYDNMGRADEFRGGVLFAGYKGYRLGWNSDKIRAGIQNTIHDAIGVSHFRQLDIPGKIYYQYVIPNPFTLW